MPAKIADRVADLERDMAELKQVVRSTLDQGVSRPASKGAWRATIGAFKDDPFYDDMVRIGRDFRRRQPKC